MVDCICKLVGDHGVVGCICKLVGDHGVVGCIWVTMEWWVVFVSW